MVFGTGFHSLNNEIHSDSSRPTTIITKFYSSGVEITNMTLTGQLRKETSIEVRLTFEDTNGEKEQISNLTATDFTVLNCGISAFNNQVGTPLYSECHFNLNLDASITNPDGSTLCQATLLGEPASGGGEYDYSDKANGPGANLTISWYPDTTPPVPTFSINQNEFTTFSDFGSDIGVGANWEGDNYYTNISPIDITITMSEEVVDFAQSDVAFLRANFNSWHTNLTTSDNITWTGKLNLNTGTTTPALQTGAFRDRAQNNTDPTTNNNDSGSIHIDYNTTAPTIQSENLSSDTGNSNTIANNSRTNDNHIYLHITLSEPDTNFYTTSIGTLFNTTNCTIDDMTHVSPFAGKTFRVKITPNPVGNDPFTQCEFSIKANSFMDRHRNNNSSSGTSWTWKHDIIVPEITAFQFTDGTVGSPNGTDSPNTTSFIATGNIEGVLNFSEDVLNVGTGNIQETSIPLGFASSVSGSGSNYTWTFSGIPAATTAMSPTPLVFKYNHGSVTDLGGSAVSPTPSDIYIEYGDPVPVTMLFDINNDDFGTDSTTNMTYFKVIFDMIEPYTGSPRFHFTTDGTTLMNPSPVGTSGSGAIVGSGYRYHFTLTSIWPATPNAGTAILVWDTNPAQVANSLGKYIQPPPNITWNWDQTLTPTFLFEDPDGTSGIGALSTISYNYPIVIIDYTVGVTGHLSSRISFGSPANFTGDGGSLSGGLISSGWISGFTGVRAFISVDTQPSPIPNSGTCQVSLNITGVHPVSNSNINFAVPSSITWNWDFTQPSATSAWTAPSGMFTGASVDSLQYTIKYIFSTPISQTDSEFLNNLASNSNNNNMSITFVSCTSNSSNDEFSVTFTIPSVTTSTPKHIYLRAIDYSSSYGESGFNGSQIGWTQLPVCTVKWYFVGIASDTVSNLDINGDCVEVTTSNTGGSYATGIEIHIEFSEPVTRSGWPIFTSGTSADSQITPPVTINELYSTGSAGGGFPNTYLYTYTVEYHDDHGFIDMYIDTSFPGITVTSGATISTTVLPRNYLRWNYDFRPHVRAVAWGISNITVAEPTAEGAASFNNWSADGFKDFHLANTPGDIGTGLDELQSSSHSILVWVKFNHPITSLSTGVASPSASTNLVSRGMGGTVNRSTSASAIAAGVENMFWSFYLWIPNDPASVAGETGSITYSWNDTNNYTPESPGIVAGTTNLSDIVHNWSTVSSGGGSPTTVTMLFDTTGNNTGDSDEITTTSSTATVVNLIIEFSSAVSGFSFVPGTSVSFTANSSWATTTDSQTLVSGTKFHIGEWTLQSGAPVSGSLEVSLSLSGITSDNGASMGSAPANVTWNFNRGFYMRYFDAAGILGEFYIGINSTSNGGWDGTSGKFETHAYEKDHPDDSGPNGNGWVGDGTDTGTFYDWAKPMQHVGPNVYSNFTASGGPSRPSVSTHPQHVLTGNDYLSIKYWYCNGTLDETIRPNTPKFYYYNDGSDFENSAHHHGSSIAWKDGVSTTNTGITGVHGQNNVPGTGISFSSNFANNFTEIPSDQRPTWTTLVSSSNSHPDYNGSPGWDTVRVHDIEDGETDDTRTPRTNDAMFYHWKAEAPSTGGWANFALGTPYIYMVFTHTDID